MYKACQRTKVYCWIKMCVFFLKQVLKITESLIKLQFQSLIKFYQKLCKEAGGLINDISKFKSPPFKNRIKRFLENFVEKKVKITKIRVRYLCY